MNQDLRQKYEIKPIDLRRTIKIDGPDTTECMEGATDLELIIGQDRAMNAIESAMNTHAKGFNVYASNCPNIETLKTIVESYADKPISPLTDKVAVFNFDNKNKPKILHVPKGQGKAFKKDMENMYETSLRRAGTEYEAEYQAARSQAEAEAGKASQAMTQREKEMFKKHKVKYNPDWDMAGMQSMQMSQEELTKVQSLLNEKDKAIDSKPELRKEYDALTQEKVEFSQKINGDLQNLDADITKKLPKKILQSTAKANMKKYGVNDEVKDYINKYSHDLLSAMKAKIEKSKQGAGGGGMMAMLGGGGGPMPGEEESYVRYQMKVVVDNSKQEKAPVIVVGKSEFTKESLFGFIQRPTDNIMRSKDQGDEAHMKISAGAILKADGGYLAFDGEQFLINNGLEGWLKVVESLQGKTTVDDKVSPYIPSMMETAPTDVNLKAFISGPLEFYHQLFQANRITKLKENVKILADFNSQIDCDADSLCMYAKYIKNLCDKEKITPVSKEALGVILEYGVELADKQTKIATNVEEMADIVREADREAKIAKDETITPDHIAKVMKMKKERNGSIDERISEAITEGSMIINVEGEEVGTINALAVYDLGFMMTGKPSRVTTETYMGSNLKSLEMEINMSGPSHQRSIHTIAGHMNSTFGQNKKVALGSSTSFEQNYGGIDGDSASISQYLTILSSLAETPIDQGIAVTGSMDQKGNVQPIGGVNQKVEGHFYCCKAKGLTGKQGVLIPHQNRKNLMLDKEVIEAVKAGEFHVYSMASLEDAVEITMGMEAGERKEDFSFDDETVFGKVDAKLTKWYKDIKGDDTETSKSAKPEECSGCGH